MYVLADFFVLVSSSPIESAVSWRGVSRAHNLLKVCLAWLPLESAVDGGMEVVVLGNRVSG